MSRQPGSDRLGGQQFDSFGEMQWQRSASIPVACITPTVIHSNVEQIMTCKIVFEQPHDTYSDMIKYGKCLFFN